MWIKFVHPGMLRDEILNKPSSFHPGAKCIHIRRLPIEGKLTSINMK